MARTVNAGKLETFMAAYRVALLDAMTRYPAEYGVETRVAEIPALAETTANKMAGALATGSYNHDGRGFKGACKALGLRHTRTAIDAYLEVGA